MRKNSFLDRLLNVLFPKDIKCIICDEELTTSCKHCVCEECYKTLPFSSEHICKRCGESLDDESDYCNRCQNKKEKYFKIARAPFIYEGDIIKLVHKFKFRHEKYLAEYLAKFLIDEYIKNDFKPDFIVPIPMTKKRLKQRGYNQTLLLCEPISEEFSVPISSDNLIKVIDTKPQVELTGKERRENLKNAFSVVDKSLFKGKTIMLVDDVYTTGSTMEEASKVLIKSGVKEVICLTFAHTKPPKDLENSTIKK